MPRKLFKFFSAADNASSGHHFCQAWAESNTGVQIQTLDPDLGRSSLHVTTSILLQPCSQEKAPLRCHPPGANEKEGGEQKRVNVVQSPPSAPF